MHSQEPPNSKIFLELRNWDNFCKYHAIGDWYGTWTKYDSKGKVIDVFKGMRSLKSNWKKTEVAHINIYTYASGEIEKKSFGPYKKPKIEALFLENSFSWGSNKIENEKPFAFETGFRYEDRGASAAVIYGNDGQLQNITIIDEQLGKFDKTNINSVINVTNHDELQGTLKTITLTLENLPDLRTQWVGLENLNKDNFTMSPHSGIFVSIPKCIKNKNQFILAVEWLATPTLLQRGIRHFDSTGFTKFTLENFKLSQ